MTYVENVSQLFRAHPLQWIDAELLQSVGGRYAWRTRVSDCRRRLGMRILNRLERDRSGRCRTCYCYVPPDATIVPEGGESQ